MSEIEEDKNLIIKLLEKDILTYKNFIPEIRKMDEESFKNFMSGKTSYSYNVPRKSKFLLLVQKVENYKFLLDWGYNTDYYSYLLEIWTNYICIEDLKGLNDEELKNFLEKNDIHYSSWPDYVKEEFKKCLKEINNTIIAKCKEMYKSLKGAAKMVIDKFKEFINYLDKMGFVDLRNLVEKYHLDIISQVLLEGCTLGSSAYHWIKDHIIESGVNKVFSKETFDFLLNKGRELANSKGFKAIEGFMAVGNLVNAIYDYIEISNIAKKAEECTKELQRINKNFESHIKNIGYDKSLEKGADLKIVFERVLEDINQDLKDLESLINKLNISIKDCENQKRMKCLQIANSVIGVGVGITSGCLTGRENMHSTLLHLGSSVIHAVSGGIHINNLVNCKKILEQLNKVLADALHLRDKIKATIEAVQKEMEIFSKENGVFPNYAK